MNVFDLKGLQWADWEKLAQIVCPCFLCEIIPILLFPSSFENPFLVGSLVLLRLPCQCLSQLVIIVGLMHESSTNEESYPSRAISNSRLLVLLKLVVLAIVLLLIGFPGQTGLSQIRKPDERARYKSYDIQYNYLSEAGMGRRHSLCCNGLFTEYSKSLQS